MLSGHLSERTFIGVSALLFMGSAAATTALCGAMAGMGGIPMPGGWMLSGAWMPMCGEGWPGAAASFLAMWSVMMAAMMLPVVTPALWRARQALERAGEARPDKLIAAAGAGYFAVWVALGLAVFPLGAVLAAPVTQEPALARLVPVLSGLVVMLAGAAQFTAWKTRRLACCREVPAHAVADSTGAAFRQGLRLGLHCTSCCAGPTAVLLVLGVMDLRAMVLVAAAIALERLSPHGERMARIVGILAIGAGALMTVQALA